jgi:hypothetical protein
MSKLLCMVIRRSYQGGFAFLYGNAFSGHQAHIFLLGEVVSLMRGCVSDSVVPVGCHR